MTDQTGDVRNEAADRNGGPGEMAATISRALVQLKKDLYGKGPVRAKTYFCDDYIFVAMDGGLTRNEETMLSHGNAELVRDYRTRFQETVSDQFVATVARIAERRVLA